MHLIYFDTASKQAVVKNLLGGLSKEGYLITGPSEGIYNMLGTLTRHKTWLYQPPGPDPAYQQGDRRCRASISKNCCALHSTRPTSRSPG